MASGSISAGRGTPEDTLRARLEVIPIFKKFPASEWVRVVAEAGIAMQPVRAPEQSHADPALVAQGSIVEVDDPELGRLRQSGLLYRMHKTPGHVRGGAANRGEHTDAVKAEADLPPSRRSLPRRSGSVATMKGPLDGVTVLDLGVRSPGHGVASCSRSSVPRHQDRSAAPELLAGDEDGEGGEPQQASPRSRHQQPGGAETIAELVKRVDVFITNMRTQAASKLGLDYDRWRSSTPASCTATPRASTTRGAVVGNDQVSNSVAGTCWEDGGMSNGGRPYFHSGSGGDLGTGRSARYRSCRRCTTATRPASARSSTPTS